MTVNAAGSQGGAATLELRQFTVRSAGTTWKGRLDLVSNAERVALVGDWAPLFQVLNGRASVASGSGSFLGCGLEAALSSGLVGFAACDPALPGSFTVMEYLRHAARLSHGSSSRAVHDATRTVDRFGLAELAPRKLAELALYQRRALGIAMASSTAPRLVCLEAPLRGLDAASAEYIARLCLEAARHGRLVWSATLPGGPSPERSLLDACDELFVLEHGALVAHGAPSAVFAAGARYSLQVKGPRIQDFLAELRSAGVRLEAQAEVGRFNVELPAAGSESTDLLLDSALHHGLTVLELVPVFAA
ncbi:MAG TPA: hypothetical protein VER12_20415 [Polyangiaceae bacterium]|nr:hypothetical protein [Polyangiaceae bacterium]